MNAFTTGKTARFVTEDQSTLLTEQTPLTQELLEEIYEELKKAAVPPRYCDICGQAVFTNNPISQTTICWDCQMAIDYEVS